MTGTDALTVYGPLGVLGAFALWLIRDYISGLKSDVRGLRADLKDERAYSRGLEEKFSNLVSPLTGAAKVLGDAMDLVARQSAVLDDRERRDRD